MAASNNPGPPPPVATTPPSLERIVAMAVAVWIIALVSYLILSDRNFDATRIYFLKILLSLSCGIMVGTLPGFLNVELTLPGIVLRAAGGAAAFVFVYTQAPNVPQLGLAPPNIKLNQINGVDFRSFFDPASYPDFSSKQMAVTIPVELKNERQPSATGTLERTDVSFNLGDQIYQFRWYYFVSMVPGQGGSWLTSEIRLRPATATDLPPGQQFSQEIMHLSDASPQWGNFESAFKSITDDFVVTLTVTLSTGTVVSKCKIIPGRYRSKIESDEQELHRVPGYISTVCET
jgi:hypothetical protein